MTYLLGTIPLLPVPLLVQEEGVVVVSHNSGGERPWTTESATISVASTKCMSTTQSYNFLVIKAHTVENVSQMFVALGRIWKTSIRRAGGDILVLSTRSVWNDGALHLLDGTNTSEDPKIRVGDPRELCCSIISDTSLN